MGGKSLSIRLGCLIGMLVLLVAPMNVAAQGAGDPYTRVLVSGVTSGSPVVDGMFTTDVVVSISNGSVDPVALLGVEIHLNFDPAVINVVDWNSNPADGIQIEPRDGLFDGTLAIGQNQADNTAGTIVFAVTQTGGSGPIYNKSGIVATIRWVGMATGTTTVTVDPATKLSDENGTPIVVDEVVQATLTVQTPGHMTGCVYLQGRTDHSGVEVWATLVDPVSPVVTTGPDGCFDLVVPLGGTQYVVTARMDGYLTAQSSAYPVNTGVVNVGNTTLRGGDATGDNRVDILDIAYIASHFLVAPVDARADINADGTVDIYDLTMAAGNFGRVGPTAW
ncbi:MAG: hypothetical protein DRI52_06985 [Chloroflexi bacterium]|nr:hypothetical protein [Anaerolineae bacterium]RLC70486.1 MAG: hypothetical protein DRI52_06985 [Chloroflexota bacterium]